MGVGASTANATRIPYRVPSAENDALVRPPVCIADSCNPLGVASPTRLPCAEDADCKKRAKCVAGACWLALPYGDSLPCSADADCWAKAPGNVGANVARCLLDGAGGGQCIYRDVARLMTGHTCDTDLDCDMGVCDTANKDLLTGQAYCGGGCACVGSGARQDTDTTTPLGFVCRPVAPCEGNPCNARFDNSNACAASENNPAGFKCTCDAEWTGPTCATRVKGAAGWGCASDADCDPKLQCRPSRGQYGMQCGPPRYEVNDANNNRYPSDRCGALDGSGNPPAPCILVGTAPTCMGDDLADCKKAGGDDMELVAVTEKTGFGGSACSNGLYKGLCAPKKCANDKECNVRKCCTQPGLSQNTCAC